MPSKDYLTKYKSIDTKMAHAKNQAEGQEQKAGKLEERGRKLMTETPKS